MRGTALAAAAIVLATGVAGCGGDSSSEPQPAGIGLVIGDLVPLRGDLAEYGPAGRKSADLAVEQANLAAQAAGAQVTTRVRHADTETQDPIGKIVARQLIQDRRASCLVGDWATSGTFAVGSDIAVPERVPLISPASSSFELSSLNDLGYIFRTAPSDDLQARALARLVAGLIGARNRSVSIAARDDVYGSRFATEFRNAWTGIGGKAGKPLLYDPGLLNHRADARRIVAGRPDAHVIVDFPASFARLAPDLLATGRFRPSRLFLPDTMATDDIRDSDVPPTAVEGAKGTLPGATAPTAPGRFFDRLFRRSTIPPRTQPGFDAQAFDATMLCFLGAVAAGSADGGAIAGELQAVSGPPGTKIGPTRLEQAVRDLEAGKEIDYEGASGPIDLNQTGDPEAGAYQVFRYRNGRITHGRTLLEVSSRSNH